MIYYRRLRKYKYQLTQTLTLRTDILPETEIDTLFIRLTVDGVLWILAGYAWDGPSGPSVDTDTFMRGSLVHDALYQLMRAGKLPLSWRDEVDTLLRTLCLEDGMSRLRAWWVYRAVRMGGSQSARPRPDDDAVLT